MSEHKEEDLSYWMGRVDAHLIEVSNQQRDQRDFQSAFVKEVRDWKTEIEKRFAQGGIRFQRLENSVARHEQDIRSNPQGGGSHKEKNGNDAITFKYLWHNYSTPVIVAFLVWLFFEGLPNILSYIR